MLKIGTVADCKMLGSLPFHAVGDKYLRAISEGMQALPIAIPAIADERLLATYLHEMDGLMLTGSHSNIAPYHYAGDPTTDGLRDSARDATCLPLIAMAIEANIPVLGICRGFQEINVALGGSLHQSIHEVPGMLDHREDPNQPLDVQYSASHAVTFTPGSILGEISASESAEVNSIHQQGVDRLAPGLIAEAHAPDGLIEAFRLQRSDRFVLGVQWHPEWKVTGNAFHQGIFIAFKRACSARIVSV
jgi:putative glutamine amidotransferase